MIVYWSSPSENTYRFVQKLGLSNVKRLPISAKEPVPIVNAEYVIITPTYGGGHKDDPDTVPKPVEKFLEANKSLLRGVIAAGNTNFGQGFCAAGKAISEKYNVPYLYRFELAGTDDDVANVKDGLRKFWKEQNGR